NQSRSPRPSNTLGRNAVIDAYPVDRSRCSTEGEPVKALACCPPSPASRKCTERAGEKPQPGGRPAATPGATVPTVSYATLRGKYWLVSPSAGWRRGDGDAQPANSPFRPGSGAGGR